MTVKNEGFVIPGKERVEIQEDCLEDWEEWRICCQREEVDTDRKEALMAEQKRMEKAVLMKLTMIEPSFVDDYGSYNCKSTLDSIDSFHDVRIQS